MHIADKFWTSVTYVVSILTLSPVPESVDRGQVPLLSSTSGIQEDTVAGPIFKPPGGRPAGPGSDFDCDYTRMPGWSPCSTPDNRACWLKDSKTGAEYNISTNYEDTNQTPIGIHRNYTLDITDEWLNADGMNFTEAKLFNGTYPGPWIQACWGDNVTVVVNNKLKSNGTSIHWHGIRQWLTMHMDGVNGVTQCPIAPGDKFNYTWRANQYGSSWYHSHHSVQYADGAAGPLTLHGPSSANYDEPKLPILMTDWGHNSAFSAIFIGQQAPSILLNGRGNVTRYNNSVPSTLPVPEPYTISFDSPTQGRAKRYLLRLINTSFESTFVFTIDNHVLEVIGADYVPIKPYNTTSVLVGIGQRYHVIVTANPQSNGSPLPKDGNYWIRTWRADCFRFASSNSTGYERSGIVRYDNSSKATPATKAWNVSTHCSDEPYESLKPVLPWTVPKIPANDPTGIGENFTVRFQDGHNIFPLALFSLGGNDFDPLRIDYSNPTFLNLNYTGKWNPEWVVVPENYTSTDWVHMVLIGPQSPSAANAHPIHLHGHDFAILQQIENSVFPANLSLKYDNPPRRDVVLLPNSGYVVIAFKTDNPGTWLMHCHIAFHASFGLALQVLERQQAAANIWPSLDQSKALQTAQQGCNNWNKWWGDCTNWWPGDGSSCLLGENAFSPDSGI